MRFEYVMALLLLLALSFGPGCQPLNTDDDTGDDDAGDDDAGDDDTADPCEGVQLPPCPPECPDDYAATCGLPCKVEGEECGNEIGDGRQCVDGSYVCSVHSPLGEGCNLVCDPEG